MKLPTEVKIVEVGPRDGLQSEKQLSAQQIITFIDKLSETGLKVIEAGSFVKTVKQMANTGEVFNKINKKAGIRYPVLTPGLEYYRKAKAVGVEEVAVFIGVSEKFNWKNLHNTREIIFKNITDVANEAAVDGIRVRGYLSCVCGSPFGDEVKLEDVVEMTGQLLRAGCYEVSLGDTTGAGTPNCIRNVMEGLHRAKIPVEKIAIHCHDTNGQALVNIFMALMYGVTTIDSSVAGPGGCPYAPGATGNVATEDLVYMLHGLGIKTGVNEEALEVAADYILAQLDRQTSSKVVIAKNGRKRRAALAESKKNNLSEGALTEKPKSPRNSPPTPKLVSHPSMNRDHLGENKRSPRDPQKKDNLEALVNDGTVSKLGGGKQK